MTKCDSDKVKVIKMVHEDKNVTSEKTVKPEPQDQGFTVKGFGGGKIYKKTKGVNSKKFEDAVEITATMIKRANHGSDLYMNENLKINVKDLPPNKQEIGVNATIEVSTKDMSGDVDAIFYKNKTIKLTKISGKKNGGDPKLVEIFADEIITPHLLALHTGEINCKNSSPLLEFLENLLIYYTR